MITLCIILVIVFQLAQNFFCSLVDLIAFSISVIMHFFTLLYSYDYSLQLLAVVFWV